MRIAATPPVPLASLMLALILALVLAASRPAQAGAGFAPVESLAQTAPSPVLDTAPWESLEDILGPLSSPRRRFTFGVLLKDATSHFWRSAARAMLDRARDLDLDLVILAGAGPRDPEGQAQGLQELLRRGCDVLLLSPQAPGPLTPLLRQAERRGLPVVNVGGEITDPPFPFVGPDHLETGRLAAGLAARLLPAGGKAGLVVGPPEDRAHLLRAQGFEDGLRGTGLALTATVHTGHGLQPAMEAAAHLLERQRDLGFLFCTSDVAALGAVEAVKDAGMTGRVAVAGADGTQLALQAVRAGDMAGTVDCLPLTLGRAAVEVGLRLARGQKPPRTLFTPQRLVDARLAAALAQDASRLSGLAQSAKRPSAPDQTTGTVRQETGE